jgi:hypothetical protein
MSDHALHEVNRARQEVVSPLLKPKQPTTWPGPVRKARLTSPTRCVGCDTQLSYQLRQMGAWWCASCKDPDGYLLRLEKASAEARDRCRTAYPAVDARQEELFAEWVRGGNAGYG